MDDWRRAPSFSEAYYPLLTPYFPTGSARIRTIAIPQLEEAHGRRFKHAIPSGAI